MKKFTLALVLTLLLALLITPAVSAASVTTESEANDTSVTADVITNGLIRGSLSNKDDVDYYKFNADKDYFELSFGISDVNLSADVGDGWIVAIYNQDMVELLSYNTKNSFATPRMPISGTIYIKVEAEFKNIYYAPIGVFYDISFSNTTDATWESEYNESSNTANAISANKVYHGSLQGAKDVDWFKSTSADYFNVTFNVNTTIDTSYEVNDGWKLSFYDSSMNLLDSYTVETTGTSINFPVTGNVYVKVEADYANIYYAPIHAYYDLQINSVTDSMWENEYNDTSKTATAIKQGKTYTGNLMAAKDVDYFKVKTSSKAFAIKFDVQLDEVDADAVKDGWKISVYPEKSTTAICTFTVDSLGSVQSITLPYAKDSYYYVKVEADYANIYYAPVGQTYHISVVDASEGNNWEVETRTTGVKSATTLKEGTTIYGNLYAKGDADYYKCKVISGGTIDVKYNREEADNDADGYKVTVLNSAGKEIASMKVDDSVSGTLSKVKVSKGTYYIVVTNADFTAPGADIDYNVSFKLTLAKHSIKKVTTTKNSFKITWNKKSDVSGYEIQYATNKNFSKAKTIKISSKNTTSTTIKNTSSSKAYYIRLRTVAKDGSKTYYSPWSATSVTVNNPTVKKVSLSGSTMKVTWSKVSGATGYQVQYSTNKDFDNAKTVKISSKNTTSATIKKLSGNKTYYVRVRATIKSGKTTSYSSWTSASVILTKTTVKKVTTGSTMKVTWNKNSGASGYQVQYSTNKNFSGAKTVKISSKNTTSATIKKLSGNKTYYVRVRAFVKSGKTTTYSAWSATSVGVTAPSVSKVTPNANTLKVTWAKNSGATSYQIQYSTSKSFSNAKTLTASKSNSSVTITNTSANTTYYVRIRTVVKGSSATNYSLWSSAYSVKTK